MSLLTAPKPPGRPRAHTTTHTPTYIRRVTTTRRSMYTHSCSQRAPRPRSRAQTTLGTEVPMRAHTTSQLNTHSQRHGNTRARAHCSRLTAHTRTAAQRKLRPAPYGRASTCMSEGARWQHPPTAATSVHHARARAHPPARPHAHAQHHHHRAHLAHKHTTHASVNMQTASTHGTSARDVRAPLHP